MRLSPLPRKFSAEADNQAYKSHFLGKLGIYMTHITPHEFLRNHTLLFDGAMGTYLAQQFRSFATKCEQLNIDSPERVLAVHRAYILAGANALKTNTFGANRRLLDCDEKYLRRIITAGWQLAEQAASETPADRPAPFIFADIGPIPTHDDNERMAEYREIVDIFIELGCQCFLFETFATAADLPKLAAYIKAKLPQAFIITSFAVQPDGFTVSGESGTALFSAMQDSPVDAVGFNCVSGPYHLRELIKNLPHTNRKLLSVMPNAGYPTVLSNRTHFGSNPAYFAEQISQIAALGAKIVGGCCGTTPEHIAAIADTLAQMPLSSDTAREEHITQAKPQPQPNHFRQKAENGGKLLAVELEPPANVDLAGFMQKAELLKANGVDIITVPDCPIGRARMDSSLLACKLKRELGVDVLPHLTCRDRNLNAIKALLLGLSAENVNNVLIITGDPIPTAERDEIKSVFNFNSRMLARYISSLNDSELVTPFYICGALNINALNFDVQLRLAQEKIAGGVQMLLTQPVLSQQAYDNLLRAKQELPVKILAGIMPVMSHRNAMFMNNEVAGITVCQEICDLYADKTKDEGRALAVKISTQIAKAVLPHADGLYMISPFNRVDVIADICENLRAETAI